MVLIIIYFVCVRVCVRNELRRRSSKLMKNLLINDKLLLIENDYDEKTNFWWKRNDEWN